MGLAVVDRARGRQPLDVARELLQPIGADAEAEILGGDVLELVRFVEHGVGAGRNHLAEGVLADRRVGAQQMMIHDHEIRGGGALAHARDEALVVPRALGAEAGLGGCGDLVPEGQVLREVLQLGAIAGLGARRPLFDDRKKDVMNYRRAGRAASQLIHPVQAEIVRAALHVGRGERDPERVTQRRNVLEVDLLLEVLGAGRDEHALAAENRRDEVRERLARAGPRFGEQHAAVFERARDRGRHFDLARARLEVGHRPGQRAVRREDVAYASG